MHEKYILTGDVQNGEQYKITDTENNYKYRNNKADKQKICDLLNNLESKNERLRNALIELQIMIQHDVDSGIKTYPAHISEFLLETLQELDQ